MKIKKLLLAAFFISSFYSVAQQTEKCKTDELRKQNMALDPSIVHKVEEINQFTRTFTENYDASSRGAAVVTLPVVVHVIYRNSAENISDAQINSQMAVLNADFRKLNSNFSSTPTAFQGIAADCEIEFCLASTDPSGNPTNGITRTSTTVSGIGNTNNYYSTARGGKDSWDVTKYINIWVCNLGGGLLGFAYLPGTASPASADGLVIGHQYFGTTGTALNSTPNHLGRTATHEMGHYFNLEHVWGLNGGCNDDDFVGDTPSQDAPNGGCPSFPSFDACTSTGNGVNFNNYLDYTDDNCMTMFTAGQKVRMLAALNGPRSGLLASNGCAGGSTSVLENENTQKMIRLFPNPTNGFVTFEFENNEKNYSIQLVDVLGKVQMSFEVTNSKTMDLSSLPKGVYFVYCNGLSQSNKLVITN